MILNLTIKKFFLYLRQMFPSVVWIWIIISFTILFSSGIVWIKAKQQNLQSHFGSEQMMLRKAQTDLMKAYLHISLAGEPKSPFDYLQGLALLDQSKSYLEQALRSQYEYETGKTLVLADESYSSPISSFMQSVQEFRKIVSNQHSDPAKFPNHKTDLRIAFFNLERNAREVDLHIQRDLTDLMARYENYYSIILWGAGIFAGLFALVLLLASQARKTAEENLEVSETIYRTLVRHLPQRIFIKDKNFAYVSANSNYARDLGITPEEIVGKNDFDFYPAELAEAYRADDRAVIKSGGMKEIEEKYIIAGNERLIHTVKVPYRDSEDNIIGVLGVFEDITERKQAELALVASEAQYRELWGATVEGIVIHDKGTILEVNDAMCRMFGVKREETIGRTILDFAAPDEPERLRRHIASGATSPIEVSALKSDGTRLMLEAVPKEIYFHGKHVRMVATRDITERKAAESLLRENENRMRMIVEGTPYLFFYTQDKNAKITYISPSAEKITGHSIFEWYNSKDWFVTGNPLNKIAKEKTYAHLRGEVTKGSIFVEVEHADKHPILLEVYETPIIQNGEVVGLQGVAHDITVRKHAEEVQRKLSRAVEQSPASVIITNREGKIEYVNKKFIEVSGYTYEEVIEKNPRLFKSGFHDANFYSSLWNTIKEGNEWKGEILNKKKNGDLYWESVLISPLEDDQGMITHFVAIQEDISEKKKMFAELIAAKEGAEASDKMKTEFLAQVSHEIRTPLNILLSFSSMIREELSLERSSEYSVMFEGISNAGKRIVRTIDLILNSSEVQLGSYVPSLKQLHLVKEIIDDTKSEYITAAKNKNLKLNILCLTDHPIIYADWYSVNQIFINLLDNAIKYTDSGSIDVIIDKTEDQRLFFSVKDSGVGISADFLPHLFDPFMQEERGYTRRFEGNGLGLSLVKKYCEYNNAVIDVESEKGVGSKFTVTFSKY